MPGIASLLMRFISLILGIEQMQSFPPPLEKEEEAEMFRRMRGGDKKARDVLIERNLRLVSHIIRKYYSSYSAPDELLSVGSLGLIKAVDTFKSEYGTRFATYGAKCVQNEILMFFRGQKKLQHEVSINDTIDIDKDGNPLTYLDIISVDENIAEDIDLKIHTERLRKLVDTVLSRREREIIVLRYGLSGFQPRTQREVAKYLGISRSYVSRIEKKAMLTLREAFGSAVPDFSD
ncbi:MAG: RNA polymerase sporulation sigma factor SigK [Clostridia bacterium]|nr:RNA polymerase sporulation sigma factor SigK [Clostridia bacterium]